MKKKEKRKKKKSSLIIIVVLIAMILTIVLIKNNITIYNVSDRTKKIQNYTDNGYPIMAWVKIQGTNIDYPVMYSQDENSPLEQIDVSYAWTNSSSLQLNPRTIVTSHNIRNVSSKPLINEKSFDYFENLPSYLYYDFVKNNKYIQYTINNKNYVFKIYSVAIIDEADFSYDEYMGKEDRENYIKKAIQNSYFDFNIDVNSDDKLITVTTCTRFFGKKSSLVKVEGRMVRQGEKYMNYKVKKKANYKEIEKIMKGDEKNEEV